jgi:hypothetical protein
MHLHPSLRVSITQGPTYISGWIISLYPICVGLLSQHHPCPTILSRDVQPRALGRFGYRNATSPWARSIPEQRDVRRGPTTHHIRSPINDYLHPFRSDEPLRPAIRAFALHYPGSLSAVHLHQLERPSLAAETTSHPPTRGRALPFQSCRGRPRG